MESAFMAVMFVICRISQLGYHASMNDNKSPAKILPPRTEDELLMRCQYLAGKTLGVLAAELGVMVPDNLLRHKGWVGNLLELYLGADAGNKAEPDFVSLGIEMKTLPLNAQGQPKESTYVCTVSMSQSGELSWQDSWLKRKLAHVLWVPIEADVNIPLAERYVGNAWLWQLNGSYCSRRTIRNYSQRRRVFTNKAQSSK
jgi:DNA mismatch repair endonuclease MutH